MFLAGIRVQSRDSLYMIYLSTCGWQIALKEFSYYTIKVV